MKARTFVVAVMLGLASCQQAPLLTGVSDLTRSWVAIEPIQCLGNPWERDWIASHGGNYAAYPRDPSKAVSPAEVGIIKDFYRRQGVVVFDTDTATRGRYVAVCAACSCPEGFTLYLEVRHQDVDAMLRLGYRLESPS